MTSYNTYSQPMPLAILDPQFYHLNVVQRKCQELLGLEEKYKAKHKKYSKALVRLTWLNGCSSGSGIASGISSVTTLSMFISLLVSISLGAIFLVGISVSGVAMALTKKYQEKLTKVTKLVDIITLALAVFERSVSKAVNIGENDKQEFTMLQALDLEATSKLANVNCKMEAKTRVQLQKVCWKGSTTSRRL